MRLSRISFICLLFCGLFLTASVAAQINTGTITGSVTDSQGGVIPGASITITQTDLGVSTTLITNDAGAYVASGLRPGPYEVRVEMPGFRSAVQNVELRIQDRLDLSFSLQVGQVTDQVEVIGEAIAVSTESGQLGSVIDSQQIQDLPLDGRRYSDLILLSPGAVPAPGAQSNPREARINVDGNFSLQNYFALNGVDNNTFTTNAQERSPQAVSPPPDALQSFKIQTRTYDAEFGWSQGAVVNAEIRSGANAWHGSGWYFHRNDNLNANNFFNNQAGVAKGEELRHQYGFTFGGKIIEDTAFFFTDYQRTNGRKAGGASGTVPTAQMKNGIFTGDRDLVLARDGDGNPIVPEIVPCVDEENDVLNLNAMRTDGLPCADPAGVKLAALYPDGNNSANKFSYQSALNVPLKTDSFDVRIDINSGEKDLFYGSYSFLETKGIIEQGPFPNPIATGGFTANSFVRGQLAAVTWNRVWSPAVFNSLRFGFNRIYSTSDPVAPEGNLGPEFGLENLPNNFAFGLPPINVSGYSKLGTSEWRPQFQKSQVYQLLDNLTWVRGNHSMKFGFEWKRALNNYLDVRAPNGAYAIPNFWVGDGVANLLLGQVADVRITTDLVPHTFTDGVMFYVQDAWRATPDLTINFGVRYEYFTPMQERDRKISNFDPEANGGRGALVTAFPVSDTSIPSCGFDCFQAGPSGDDIFAKTLIHPDRNNWAPRVGLSYRLNDTTVIKGGYAIFYQAMDRIGSSAQLPLNAPMLIEFRGNRAFSQDKPKMLLRDPFPSLDPSFDPTTLGVRGRDMNETAPWSQQYSFGLEFQLGSGYLLDTSYVGGDSNNIRKLRPFNQGIIVGSGSTASITKPYPDWDQRLSDYLISDGNANYNALQVSLRRAFASGLAFNVGYTWSKALGDTQDNLSGGGEFNQIRPQNAYDLDADYGRLVFDQAHRLVVNWVYELPFGPGKDYLSDGVASQILGGWQFNGIWSSTSGSPIGFSGTDNSQTDSQNSRPNCSGNISGPKTVAKYFNTDAVSQTDPFTFGNCGVASLSGWPHHNFDLSLFKNFALGVTEGSQLQFRVEFFNAFNTPQFRNAENNSTSGNFGRTLAVLDPEKEARTIQFGLKLSF